LSKRALRCSSVSSATRRDAIAATGAPDAGRSRMPAALLTSSDNVRRTPRIPLMTAAQNSPAVEDYLETVYELEESGIPVIRARLVERLGVSAPSVSETVARRER